MNANCYRLPGERSVFILKRRDGPGERVGFRVGRLIVPHKIGSGKLGGGKRLPSVRHGAERARIETFRADTTASDPFFVLDHIGPAYPATAAQNEHPPFLFIL